MAWCDSYLKEMDEAAAYWIASGTVTTYTYT